MQKRHGAVAAALLGSFIIVACVAAFTTAGGQSPASPSPSPGPTHSGSPSPTASASPTGSTASTTPEEDEYVTTLVPPDIKSNGSVKVLVPAGSAGLDDALAKALGAVMGVNWVTVPVSASDNTIVQNVQSGQNGIGIGLSDLTENLTREKQVDFVTYLTAPSGPQGIAFAKNNGLEKATQAALIVLIADGNYQKIFAQWGPAHATPVTTTGQDTIISATS